MSMMQFPQWLRRPRSRQRGPALKLRHPSTRKSTTTKGLTCREWILLLSLLGALGTGHFRTFVKVNHQLTEFMQGMITTDNNDTETKTLHPTTATAIMEAVADVPDVSRKELVLAAKKNFQNNNNNNSSKKRGMFTPKTKGSKITPNNIINNKNNKNNNNNRPKNTNVSQKKKTQPKHTPQKRRIFHGTKPHVELDNLSRSELQSHGLLALTRTRPISHPIIAHNDVENLPKLSDSELLPLQESFYSHHQQQMKEWLPDFTSFIQWGNTRQRSFEVFWKHFPKVYRPHRNPKKREANTEQTPYYYWETLCHAAKGFRKEVSENRAIPHIVILNLNENWSMLSEQYENRTTDWTTNLAQRWLSNHCSPDYILRYLNDPLLKAVVTTQFQSIDHPKVHSIPLGLHNPGNIKATMKYQTKLPIHYDRPRWLLVNHKRRPMRNDAVDAALAHFPGVTNKYTKGVGEDKFFESMLQSKFVLAPGGLGFDTYRIYEALYLGTIPVLETLNRTDGWYRTLDNLPVAWIDSYANLTPEWLEQEYQRILQRPPGWYKYEKLTLSYWIDFIKEQLTKEGNLVSDNALAGLKPPNHLPTNRNVTEGEQEEGDNNTDTIDASSATTNKDTLEDKIDDNEAATRQDDDKTGIAIPGEQSDQEAAEPMPSQLVSTETGNVPLSPEQEEFYSYHRKQILKYVNESSAIIWDTRVEKKTFRPLWELIDNVYRPGKVERENPQLEGRHFVFYGSICHAAQAFDKYRQKHGKDVSLPHVLFFRMNENWGGFSETIPDKTADWVLNLPKEWAKTGCSKKIIWDYLDHPDTKAAFTMQFQQYNHPKVHSLPLGIYNTAKVKTILSTLGDLDSPLNQKTQLLMINSKHRPMREASVEAVVRNFNRTIGNTYGKGKSAFSNYFAELKRSKFIMSPSGLGMDCYRHWEAVALGVIPVLEHLNRKDAWYDTFEDLPVAWVDYYYNLTPEYLEKEYERIISKAHTYKYEKLTKQYWVDFIKAHVEDPAATSTA